ncbi:MAG: glycosyltransferase family 2 protein, partial [Acidimicrobiales bacterium]
MGWAAQGSVQRRRRADLQRLAVELARADFAKRHPGATFGPVVALIAAYEEEANLGGVLRQMPVSVCGLDVSTLVVVDGGTDGTDRVAVDAGVFTCVLPVNLGQGAALRLGYELALAHGARFVATLDADGQNDPSELETLVEPLVAGEADFVIASRRLGVDHTTDWVRRLGVRIYARALNAIIDEELTDSSNGFRAYRADLLEDIIPHLRQDQYQTAEVVITASTRGWRIVQRPSVWLPRASGHSKKGSNLVFGLHYAWVIGST